MIEYNYIKSPVNLGSLLYELSLTNISGTLDCVSFDEPDSLEVCYLEPLSTADKTTLDAVVADHTGEAITEYIGDLEYYLTDDALVTDSQTGISGTFIPMQVLVNRRDLYNDEENPLYVEGFTPILGASGTLQSHADQISNLNTAISDDGWYTHYIKSWTYPSPMDLLIYYGWLNSFNSSSNSWNNEKVAQDFAKYNYLVFGDGIQTPTHTDYSNTEVIIPRIKALNPRTEIFGYVSANQTLTDFQTKVDDWEDLHIDGIFIDEAGYDYGITRSEFNARVDYVHSKVYSNTCFVNAWNLDHVLGVDDDPSYPNSTYNTISGTSNLLSSDWCLLESFPINTTAYSTNNGYETKSEWANRGSKANLKRYNYGVNLAAVGIINNSNSNGQALFNFGFVSSMMWNLDAFGTSDTSYGANSAAVTYWNRPKTEGLGREWSFSPSVQSDGTDSDVYVRYLDFAKLKLDFSSSAQSCDVTKSTSESPSHIRFRSGDLTEGLDAYPQKTTASGKPITGLAYDDTVEEAMYSTFEIPSNWTHGSDINLKVSFFNDYSQTGDTTCRWALDYHIYQENDIVSSKTTSTAYVNKIVPTDASADTFMQAILNIPHNDSNNPIIRDGVITFRFYRDSSDVADSMLNDAILVLLTFEIQTEVV